MKKIFVLASAFLAIQFPTLAARLPASETKISVLGLEWGSSAAEVKRQLIPRFSVNPTTSNLANLLSVEGEINGREVTVVNEFTPKTKKLMKVSIRENATKLMVTSFLYGWKTDVPATLIGWREDWSQILTKKYGEPTIRVRSSEDRKGVLPFAGTHGDIWRLSDGNISCYVSSGTFSQAVIIDYEQDAMQKIGLAEREQLISEQDEATKNDL